MSRLKSSEINILLALLVVVSGSWAFIELADEVREGETLSFDNQILITMRKAEDPAAPVGPQWLKEAMRDISSLGSTAVLSALVLSVVGFLILDKRYGQAVLIGLTSLIGVLMVIGLKYLFVRERPDVVLHLTEVTSQSYPSGHTMMSAVIYLSLASMLAPILKQKRLKIYIILIALTATFLVGISRIYLGVHFPTDVLSGWAIGLAWAALSWLLFQYLNIKFALNKNGKTYDTA